MSPRAMVVAAPKPGVMTPPPATVVMMWVTASMRRTVSVAVSVKNRLPAASVATSLGELRRAASALPPSPSEAQSLGRLEPATRVMTWVTMSTLRTVQYMNSMKYTLPAGSTAIPKGIPIQASVAGPPLPSWPM